MIWFSVYLDLFDLKQNLLRYVLYLKASFWGYDRSILVGVGMRRQ